MANEAQVRAGLTIGPGGNVGGQSYRSQPTAWNESVSQAGGPTPGEVLVTTQGTDINLSQLTQPGLCRMMNLDPTNFVTVGIKDAASGNFYPLLELPPVTPSTSQGKSYVLRLSRYIQEELQGTGTANIGATTLHALANQASCRIIVEAFES